VKTNPQGADVEYPSADATRSTNPELLLPHWRTVAETSERVCGTHTPNPDPGRQSRSICLQAGPRQKPRASLQAILALAAPAPICVSPLRSTTAAATQARRGPRHGYSLPGEPGANSSPRSRGVHTILVASGGKTTPDSVPKTCPQNAWLGACPPRVRLNTGSEPVYAASTNTDPLLVREVLDGVDGGNKKPPICGRFLCRREPSDGLEPSTPSLPWNASGNRSQPTATVFAFLSRFRGRSICHRLPPVATAGLHKCSIVRCLR
jgi:hypothetical protein